MDLLEFFLDNAWLLTGTLIKSLFLLVIAGFAFTRLYRRPRPSWLLIGAIFVTVAWESGLNIIVQVFAQVVLVQLLPELGVPLGDAGPILAEILIEGCDLITKGVVWLCLILAMFDQPAKFTADHMTEASAAEGL